MHNQFEICRTQLRKICRVIRIRYTKYQSLTRECVLEQRDSFAPSKLLLPASVAQCSRRSPVNVAGETVLVQFLSGNSILIPIFLRMCARGRCEFNPCLGMKLRPHFLEHGKLLHFEFTYELYQQTCMCIPITYECLLKSLDIIMYYE